MPVFEGPSDALVMPGNRIFYFSGNVMKMVCHCLFLFFFLHSPIYSSGIFPASIPSKF